MLSLKISAYALHKAGTETRLYEDAYAFDEAAGRCFGQVRPSLVGLPVTGNRHHLRRHYRIRRWPGQAVTTRHKAVFLC